MAHIAKQANDDGNDELELAALTDLVSCGSDHASLTEVSRRIFELGRQLGSEATCRRTVNKIVDDHPELLDELMAAVNDDELSATLLDHRARAASAVARREFAQPVEERLLELL